MTEQQKALAWFDCKIKLNNYEECEAINTIRAALTVNAQLVEALRDARSALSSLNYKGTTPFIRDGGTFYGQTDEWCEWVETEILPVVRQAITAAEKAGV